MIERLKDIAYGNVYSEHHTHEDYGGTKCYEEMTVAFRT